VALFAESRAREIGYVYRAEFLHDVRAVEFDAARLMPSRRAASLLNAPRTI
jgi:hypothetical protein